MVGGLIGWGGCKLRESDEESKNGRISRISAAAINAQIYRASAIGLCVRVWMVWVCPCHGDGERERERFLC